VENGLIDLDQFALHFLLPTDAPSGNITHLRQHVVGFQPKYPVWQETTSLQPMANMLVERPFDQPRENSSSKRRGQKSKGKGGRRTTFRLLQAAITTINEYKVFGIRQ
jgi:hypothetical protein